MENEIQKLRQAFQSRYSSSSPRFFQAPGRVNLIGEHTDYNDGFVMPFAIDRRVTVAGAIRSDRMLNVSAMDLDEHATVDLDDPPKRRRGNWVDYVEGAVRCVEERFGRLNGADLAIHSTVPIGAGLSSSAALEVAIGIAVLSLNDIEIDGKELALAAQQAEHQYAGTRSGIMDQFTAVFAQAENAMLLDCRSLEIDYIPVPADGAEVVVIDTRVKHDLAAGEYNTRRSECEEGVRILKQALPGIEALRDVSVEDLTRHAHMLPDVIHRRCRHVVSENERTLAAAAAFRESDLVRAGDLMRDSHRSLKVDYEVSSAELDFLVDTANEIEGVFGARMTGGGFGGCTVSLVSRSAADLFKTRSLTRFADRFGYPPDVYVFKAAAGASEVAI